MAAKYPRAGASTWIISGVAGALPALQKHDTLWFEDGNITITAGNDSAPVAFRLHRGVLSLHSEFFTNMFSLPPHRGNDNVMDNCPIVHFSDCAQHLAWLFTILYEGVRDPFFDPHRASSFAKVRAMLMLGRKYGIDHVSDEALRRLRAICPSTPAEFDAFIYVRTDKARSVTFEAEDRIAIINLARAFNLPELLPFAFYICSTHIGPKALMNGIHYGEGQHEQLSTRDLRLCLQGMGHLVGMVKSMTDTFLDFAPSLYCRNPGCYSIPQELLRSVNARGHLSLRGLLLPLSVVGAEKWRFHQLCSTCQNTLLDKHNEFRRTVWDLLAEIYNVEWPMHPEVEPAGGSLKLDLK